MFISTFDDALFLNHAHLVYIICHIASWFNKVILIHLSVLLSVFLVWQTLRTRPRALTGRVCWFPSCLILLGLLVILFISRVMFCWLPCKSPITVFVESFLFGKQTSSLCFLGPRQTQTFCEINKLDLVLLYCPFRSPSHSFLFVSVSFNWCV